jgi:hypothetical protein
MKLLAAMRRFWSLALLHNAKPLQPHALLCGFTGTCVMARYDDELGNQANVSRRHRKSQCDVLRDDCCKLWSKYNSKSYTTVSAMIHIYCLD